MFRTFTSCLMPLNFVSKRYKASTIYALSSAIADNGSPIAVIRISGASSWKSLASLSKSASLNLNSNKCKVIKLYELNSSELLDIAMAVQFKKPKSYTGEDMCELYVHGSKVVISSVLASLGRMEDLRPAEPGEFTKRAFLNGKLNLVEAEAVSDLIEAQTDMQHQRALQGLSGDTATLYSDWRRKLIRAAAHFEANIDFSENELLDDQILDIAMKNLDELKQEIENFLEDASRRSDLIKHGLTISIVGAPNAGKSSFINLLCKRELSIVSPIIGTTRDVVETFLNIKGHAVKICDTAGLRQTMQDKLNDENLIEREGIRRAVEMAKKSDMLLYVIDGSKISDAEDLEKNINEISSSLNLEKNQKTVLVLNKVDLMKDVDKKTWYDGEKLHYISCTTFQGIPEITETISNQVAQLCSSKNSNSPVSFLTERHRTHLLRMCESIGKANTCSRFDMSIGAHHVRNAINEVSSITGDITTDDILDVIFREFCIGK